MGAPARFETALPTAAPDVVGFSTGNLGIDPKRSFDRTYHNWQETPMDDAGTFIDTFNEDLSIGERTTRHRWVFRGLTRPHVAAQLMNGRGHELNGVVEYAVPLQTSEGQLYLVGAARNESRRNGPGTQLETAADLLEGPVVYHNRAKSLEEHVKRVEDQGYRFVSTLDSDVVFESVSKYWKDTYGWTDKALLDLRERLHKESQKDFPQDKKTAVFTGVVDSKGNLAAAAMAEVLPFRLTEEKNFNLWESTEWYRNPDVKAIGLVGAAVALTNARIGNQEDSTVLAETNQSTPAGAAARSAGMEIPQVIFDDGKHLAPLQVLRDNVGVRDGQPAHGPVMFEGEKPMRLPFPLRDFDIYQATPDNLDELASADNQIIVRRVLAAA